MKYFRVYSDTFEGHVFTEEAFNILKTQLCNGDETLFDSKEVTKEDVKGYETIYTKKDLPYLGYQTDGMTAQGDDEFLANMAEEYEGEDD